MSEPTPDVPVPERSAAEIEAEILKARTELAAQVDQLMGRVDPRQAVAEVPPARLAAVAAATALGIGLLVVRAVRRRRRG